MLDIILITNFYLKYIMIFSIFITLSINLKHNGMESIIKNPKNSSKIGKFYY